VETAINIAKNYNILFVTAAGNDGANVDANPSIGYFPTNFACDNLIKVAADSTLFGVPTTFSNYGANSVDIAAPGIVVVAGRNDTLMISSGTSFAAPVVTALAAVEASKLSSFDWWAVKQALRTRFKPTIPAAWQGKLKATGGVLKPICD
jgi:subtilisin family serine protease